MTTISGLLKSISDGNSKRLTKLLRHGAGLKLTKDDLNTSLFVAIHQSREECVASLLSAGTDPNATDTDGKPALYVVVDQGRGNPGILSSLLRAGATPDKATQATQQTALHISCKKGFQVCVKALLAAKASIDKQDSVGNTGLHYAAKEGHVTILRYLLDRNADVNCRNNNGETPLHFSVKSKHNQCIEELLCNGADPGLSDNKGQNALFLAIKLENQELVDMLLEYNCSVNAQDTQTGKTVLHWAIQGGNLHLVEKLLGLNADPNIRDRDWQTAFLLALNMNRKDILERLMKAGCDITVTDRSFNTALHIASINGHPEMVRMLVEKGLTIDLKGSGGLSPLMLASLGGHFEAVNVLLQYGANCSLTDRNHASALVYAMLSSSRSHTTHKIVKLLIRANCDVNYAANLLKVIKTFSIDLGEGINVEERLYTPLEIAFMKGDPAIFVMLLAAGCDVSKFQCDKDMTMANFKSIHSDIKSRWILLRCIKKERKKVKSLKHLCRRPVLKLFRKDVQGTIRTLSVSEELKRFLLFSDLDDICERYAQHDEPEASSSTPPSSPFNSVSPTTKEPNETVPSFRRNNRLRSTFHSTTPTKQNSVKSPTTPVLPRATWDRERKKTTTKIGPGKTRSASHSEKPLTERGNHTRSTSESAPGLAGQSSPYVGSEYKSKGIFDFLKRSKPSKAADAYSSQKARSKYKQDPKDTMSSVLYGSEQDSGTYGQTRPKSAGINGIDQMNGNYNSPKDYTPANSNRSSKQLDLSEKILIEGVSVNGFGNNPRQAEIDAMLHSGKASRPSFSAADEFVFPDNVINDKMKDRLSANPTGSLNRPRRKKKQLCMDSMLYGDMNGSGADSAMEEGGNDDQLLDSLPPRRRSNSESHSERQSNSIDVPGSKTSHYVKPRRSNKVPVTDSNLQNDITRMAQSISSTFENYSDKCSPMLGRKQLGEKNGIFSDSKSLSPQVDIGYQTQESSLMSPTSSNSKSSYDSSNGSGAHIQLPTGDAQLLQKYLHSQNPIHTTSGDAFNGVHRPGIEANQNHIATTPTTAQGLNANPLLRVTPNDPETISTSSMLSDPSCDSFRLVGRRERRNSDSVSSLSSSDSRRTPSKIPVLQQHWTPPPNRSKLPVPISPVSTPGQGYGSLRRSKSFRKY